MSNCCNRSNDCNKNNRKNSNNYDAFLFGTFIFLFAFVIFLIIILIIILIFFIIIIIVIISVLNLIIRLVYCFKSLSSVVVNTVCIVKIAFVIKRRASNLTYVSFVIVVCAAVFTSHYLSLLEKYIKNTVL